MPFIVAISVGTSSAKFEPCLFVQETLTKIHQELHANEPDHDSVPTADLVNVLMCQVQVLCDVQLLSGAPMAHRPQHRLDAFNLGLLQKFERQNCDKKTYVE